MLPDLLLGSTGVVEKLELLTTLRGLVLYDMFYIIFTPNRKINALNI